MVKFAVGGWVVCLAVIVGACARTSVTQAPVNVGRETATQSALIESDVDYSAGFEVITQGIRRNFSRGMYQNRSSEVFVESTDSASAMVRVRKEGVTWGYFFDTLPMSVTKTCLVTGTKEEYCSNSEGKLRFFINDIEDPDALDKVIIENDKLRIEFSK